MSDQLENLKTEDTSLGDRSLNIPSELPILPLRDTVLFPNSFMPLAVARESSVRLIDDAIANGKLIAVFTQRDAATEEPGQADLYPVGTATHIHKMFKLPDGSLRLIVQGLSRLTLDEVVSAQPYLRARVSAAMEGANDADRLEIDALARNIKTNFQQVVSLSPLLSDDLQTLAMNITEPGRLADFIASSLSTISTGVKQEVLETLDIRARLDNLNRILIKELEVLELGSKIQSQVQSEVGKNQRDYFLREQMKAIQKELGEGDDQTKEIEEIAEKVEAAGMPDAVKKEAVRELDRLSKMPVAAAEYTVSRTYLDWLVTLPWAKRTEEVIDLGKTKQDELPPGRKPIMTKHFNADAIEQVWSFVKQQVDLGRQAYVVYPVIEDSETQATKAAQTAHTHLSKEVFPNTPVALLHGRMPAAQKEAVMAAFKAGDTKILVATTVIEVGVDVPNATVMVIEQAERFGLSQLHQLRGRVGRGGEQSYCLLVTDKLGDTAKSRIRTMTETNDGFKIAEVDLQLRGPGEFFGTKQSGLPALKIANILRDREILEIARREALDFVARPPSREALAQAAAYIRDHWQRKYGLVQVG